jgi:hypothetical protein
MSPALIEISKLLFVSMSLIGGLTLFMWWKEINKKKGALNILRVKDIK